MFERHRSRVQRRARVALQLTKPGDVSPSALLGARHRHAEWTMDATGMVKVPLDRPGIGIDVDVDRVDQLRHAARLGQ
jgi:L-alanine-DL-glutamate epimerase-like enolase superfamily enzyme